MTKMTLLIPLLAILLSCGQATQPGNSPQTNAPPESTSDVRASQQPSVAQPPPVVAAPPPPETGDLLLEEKIIINNTIVLATLASTTSEVVLASDVYHSGIDHRYIAILKFNLTVHEYLKGSGPTNITAIWLDGITYDTSARAESARAAIAQRRDTQWDSARAVIFLVGDHGGSVEWVGTTLTELLQRSDHYYLSDADRYHHLDDRYSLHSRSRVLWFPEHRPRLQAEGLYMMTLPPNPQLITLSALKQRTAAVTAELAIDDSEAYRKCVVEKYKHMRHTRNWPVERGAEFTNWDLVPSIESGLPVSPAYLRGQRSTGVTFSTHTPIPLQRGWKARTRPCSASLPEDRPRASMGPRSSAPRDRCRAGSIRSTSRRVGR